MKRQHTGHGRSRNRLLGVVISGLLIGAACGGDDGGGGGESLGPDGELPANFASGGVEADGEPTEGGTITVGLESESNSFAPWSFIASQAGINVAYAIFDPLATYNAEGEVEPYLAESIEPNEDFTEWTLTLPDGVKFHDGTDLDAEALKTMFDDYLTVEGANTAGALRDVDEMVIEDPLTVRYVLSKPHAAFPDILTLGPGWPFSPTAAADLGDDFGSQPVGTGPFQFVNWQRDGALDVERNPEYWQDGQPYLDEVTFRPIPDEETRASSLETRDIDAAQSVRLSAFLDRVRNLPGVEIALGMSNGAGNITFNVGQPPVDDVRIRRALAHATDQQAVVEVVAGPAVEFTEVRNQYWASDSPYHSDAVDEVWPEHDPEQAEQLLQEYMDDPDRSDGEPVGSPVSVQLDATNVAALVQQARAYEGLWEDVGFEVEVEPVEQSIHIQEALSGDFQIKSFRAGTDADPLTTAENSHGEPEDYALNWSDFTSETVEDVIETLRSTDDVEERAAATEELSIHLAEEMPIYWTGSDLALFAHDESVKGLASWKFPNGSLGDGATPAVTFWGQVWVEE